MLCDENDLLAAAVGLGARRIRGWSPSEEARVLALPSIDASQIRELKEQILKGEDPLGDALCAIRSPAVRRELGAVYTPKSIVRSMLAWAKQRKEPVRIVDPGAGSGRFLIEAGRVFPDCDLLGIEIDPVAAILARAGLAAMGFEARSEIALADYCGFGVPRIEGVTLYIGNPPYLRHHGISRQQKDWMKRVGNALGLKASALAGLYVYFFFETARSAGPGDFGAYVTASEWLDVGYGAALRQLFLEQLGGEGITILAPEIDAFPGTATTATITTFALGSKPKCVRLKKARSIAGLADLTGGREIDRGHLARETRWTRADSPRRIRPEGHVELGELCRVHRGQVTGANGIWIIDANTQDLPTSVLYPCVTRARELIRAGTSLRDVSQLRLVVDLPQDLDCFEEDERRLIDVFLCAARERGGDRGYVATHRRVWWRVGLRAPAPILATYMARRPPAFVRNLAEARHVNIAHGIYPREPMTDQMLEGLVKALTAGCTTRDGRTYSGGLTKFEPKEMERLYVPESP